MEFDNNLEEDISKGENLQSQNNSLDNSKNILNKSQKIALVFLSIFSLLIIIFWMIQLNNNLQSNTLTQVLKEKGKEEIIDSECNSPECLAKKEEEKKQMDSDEDGISDWDEENVYQTSPYLPDSDSDGVDDKVEIVNNQDPNCPKGKTCDNDITDADLVDNNIVNPVLDTSLGDISSVQNNLMQNQNQQVDISKLSDSQKQDLIKLLETEDLTPLRQTLIQSGVAQEELDKISDEDLINLYKNIILGDQAQVQNQNQQVDISKLSDSQKQDLIKLLETEDLTPLRQNLIQSGMASEELDRISDEDLINLYKNIILGDQ